MRLIDAAGEIFAERGFRHATVREIVARAGANVAAINYHFRDKLGLYREVFAHASKVMDERHPIAPLGSELSNPNAAMRAFVRSFAGRCLEQSALASWYTRLLAREALEPTILLDEIVGQHVGPTYKRLKEICKALVGADASEMEIATAAVGVMGECLAIAHMRPMMERLEPTRVYDEQAIDRIAEHVAEMALAGLTRRSGCIPNPAGSVEPKGGFSCQQSVAA